MTGPSTIARYGPKGYWRVFVSAPGGAQEEITTFRGAPTEVSSLTYTDPFGPATASLRLPAVTIMDRPGTGDLEWLVPWANVDVVHYDGDSHQPTGHVWEGLIASEEISEVGLGLSCKGAAFQLDNFLAAPTYPQRPIPYEVLISQAFDPVSHPSLRTAPLVIEWPADWNILVPSYPDDTPWYMRPWGVDTGARWTGLTSRSTGSWEPTLTGFVQTLLAMMYVEGGSQWTIRLDRGRVPVLYVRRKLLAPTATTLTVQVGVHGVQLGLSRDFTGSSNVIYAQGSDLAGTSFSGMQVTTDGKTTYYEPFAALPYVYPATDTNPRLIPAVARKESMLQLPPGVDQQAGRDIAQAKLRSQADPGYTGTLTLTTDPMVDGDPYSRFLITAGQPILVRGVRGNDLLLHISSVTHDLNGRTSTLTVDTKFRDSLTVEEVQARTRDALDPVRLLQVGRYSNTVQDLIKPWSYVEGSGVIPSGGALDATELFNSKMPGNAKFPWTAWTTKYPPKDFPQYYIKIDPKSADATDNWSGVKREGINRAAIPFKLSQGGTIRLTQIAAYDADGNVMPVRFHVGLYGNTGVSPLSMPMVPAGGYAGYAAGQRYPFFPGAFENIRPDGTEQDSLNYLPADQIDMFIAWGNYYEPAGYSPGLASRGASKTGMLVDESAWTFDTTMQTGFDKYSVQNTRSNNTTGMGYALIYCDDQGTQPVYFLGRLMRDEPGG